LDIGVEAAVEQNSAKHNYTARPLVWEGITTKSACTGFLSNKYLLLDPES